MLAALEGNEDDEDRLIEERRRRRQEILAKHAEATAVTAPTASALASNAAAGSALAGGETAAAPAADDAEAAALDTPEAAAGGAAAAATPASAPQSPRSQAASPAADAREGSASPSLSSGSGGAALDIWQRGDSGGAALEDDAASRPATEGMEPRPAGAAPSVADGQGSTLGADVDEAEFKAEAEKAQEQTQVQVLELPTFCSPHAQIACTVHIVLCWAPPGSCWCTVLEAGASVCHHRALLPALSWHHPRQSRQQVKRGAGAEFDMFAEEAEAAVATAAAETKVAGAGLADSYDDADGYYNLQAGPVPAHSSFHLARCRTDETKAPAELAFMATPTFTTKQVHLVSGPDPDTGPRFQHSTCSASFAGL